MEKRKLTVYAGSGNKNAYIPQIILQGKWLEAIGFSIGDKVTVDCEPDRIVIEKKKPPQEIIE